MIVSYRSIICNMSGFAVLAAVLAGIESDAILYGYKVLCARHGDELVAA